MLGGMAFLLCVLKKWSLSIVFGGMTYYHRVAFPSASCVMKVKINLSIVLGGMACVVF